MKTKHTQGEWITLIEGDAITISSKVETGFITLAQVFEVLATDELSEQTKSNARLIAAAPEGLRVAISTYISLLQMPVEAWRIENQKVFIDLRDYISKATGKPQEFYEQVAILIKHDGLSFEQAIKKAEGE